MTKLQIRPPPLRSRSVQSHYQRHASSSLDLCVESRLSYEEWIWPAGHDLEILNPEALENFSAVFHCVASCQACDDPTHEFLREAKSFVTLIVILDLVRCSISFEYILSIVLNLCSQFEMEPKHQVGFIIAGKWISNRLELMRAAEPLVLVWILVIRLCHFCLSLYRTGGECRRASEYLFVFVVGLHPQK
jgi:hypothetical protein